MQEIRETFLSGMKLVEIQETLYSRQHQTCSHLVAEEAFAVEDVGERIGITITEVEVFTLMNGIRRALEVVREIGSGNSKCAKTVNVRLKAARGMMNSGRSERIENEMIGSQETYHRFVQTRGILLVDRRPPLPLAPPQRPQHMSPTGTALLKTFGIIEIRCWSHGLGQSAIMVT